MSYEAKKKESCFRKPERSFFIADFKFFKCVLLSEKVGNLSRALTPLFGNGARGPWNWENKRRFD